jgi:arginine decarboxylase
VLEEAERLNVVPRLGVRARLASQGPVNGSPPAAKNPSSASRQPGAATGGNSARGGRLDSIQLLHFHLGSQMANIRDIATGVRESARFYVELHKLGVNIQCFDVGGGLGVDYEGTRSQSDCSVNYGLNEYANNIIWAIGDACEENGLPHPTVITESGRAVTAHHTVLVSNIIGVERSETPKRPRRQKMPRVRCKACGKPGRRCTRPATAARCANGCTTARWICTISTSATLAPSACRSARGQSSCI